MIPITNLTIVAIHIPIAIITIVMFMLARAGDRRRPAARTFLVMIALMFGWVLETCVYYATKNPMVARFLFDVKLPFISFASMSLYMFTLRFYNNGKPLARWVIPALAVIPAITTVLSVTSPMHSLIRSSLLIDTSGVLHVSHNVRGPWFWVHSAYCYLMIAMGMITVLRNHRRQKKNLRMSSSYLLLGMAVSVCFNMFALLNIVDIPFDISLIGMALTALFIYFSLVSSEKASFLANAREEIFNATDDYILILDLARNIADVNRAARAWLAGLGLPEAKKFSDITQTLEAAGADFRSATDDDRGGTDIYLKGEGRRLILNMTEREIVDNAGNREGTFVTLSDVTGNRGLIERLSTVAGIDALTGLENRYGMELAIAAFDRPECLPIAIFFGDLNGLKEVNDRLGHKQGDNMLVHASTLLKQACPEGGRLFRIGGDEFVILAPGCSSKQAMAVILEINELMSAISGYPYRLSMALGYAVKESPEQDLSALIEEADQKMYTFKRESKGARSKSIS